MSNKERKNDLARRLLSLQQQSTIGLNYIELLTRVSLFPVVLEKLLPNKKQEVNLFIKEVIKDSYRCNECTIDIFVKSLLQDPLFSYSFIYLYEDSYIRAIEYLINGKEEIEEKEIKKAKEIVYRVAKEVLENNLIKE